jgi:hypothetical protein
MSRVYSTQFVAANVGGAPTEYLVPAGYVAVVRDLSIFQPNVGGTNYIACGVLEVGPFFIAYASAALQTSQHQEMRVVVNAGDHIYAVSTYALGYAFISGYLLELP